MVNEDNREYKPTYKPLVIYLLVLAAVVLALATWGVGPRFAAAAKLILLLVPWWVTGLMYIIFRGEHIYWINGLSFKEARAAGSERRRRYAYRHFKAFLRLALVLSAYMALSFVHWLPVWLDIGAMLGGLVLLAFSLNGVKL